MFVLAVLVALDAVRIVAVGNFTDLDADETDVKLFATPDNEEL